MAAGCIVLLSLLILCKSIALAGLVLLWFGWRGKRIDDHPICRKCRYDLTGLDEPTTCPECGTDLDARKAVRIGQRRKRRVMIAIGGLLTLLAVGGGTVIGVQWYRDVDPNTLKPAWWLIRELDRLDSNQLHEPRNELIRRLKTGSLADRHTQRVTELLLEKQIKSTWLRRLSWEDWFVIARAAGALSEEQWRQFLHQSFRFELHARDEVRQGAPIPLALQMKLFNSVPGSLQNVEFGVRAIHVSGIRCDPDRPYLTTGPLKGFSALGTHVVGNQDFREFVIDPGKGCGSILSTRHHTVWLSVGVMAEHVIVPGDLNVDRLQWRRELIPIPRTPDSRA